MAAVFEGSWQLLDPDEQRALAQISLFRGGFTKEAAAEIISAPWSDVLSLVDKSLLRLEANGRYTIHELLRQFSAVKLDQQGKHPVAGRQHSHYYLTFLAQRTAAFWQQSPQNTLAEIQPEFENIHAAWQTALEEKNFDLLAQSLAGLTTFYVRSGMFHEGIEILTQTIAVMMAEEGGESQSLYGWLQVELARLAAPVAQFETARESAEKGFSLAKASGNKALEGWSQFRLARTLWMQGYYEDCYPLLDDALTVAQSANIERLEAECWLALSALADTHGGNFPLARERGQKAQALFNQSGNPLGELRMLILLGNFSWGTGDYSLAQGYYEQALHLCRQVNSRHDEAAALANLATVLREQGAFEQALDYYQPALQLFRDLRDQRRGFVTLNNISLLYHHMNQQHLALDYGQQALTAVRELDTRAGESQPLCSIGHALLALKRADEAAAAYKQSLALHREAGNQHLMMDPLAGLVRTALAQNNLPQALKDTETILAHLVGGTLNGTAEPVRIQLTAYQALAAVHDPRAKNILETAYQSLFTRADKISDPIRKQSFLQNIPAHIELQSAMSALNQISRASSIQV
jgi:tetratricopeptide (TPR) repeat protein